MLRGWQPKWAGSHSHFIIWLHTRRGNDSILVLLFGKVSDCFTARYYVAFKCSSSLPTQLNKLESQRNVFTSISVINMSSVVTVFMLNVSGFPDLWDISGFFCNLVSRRKQETEWHHVYYDSNQQCNWSWHTCSFCKLLSCLSIMEQVITWLWLAKE